MKRMLRMIGYGVFGAALLLESPDSLSFQYPEDATAIAWGSSGLEEVPQGMLALDAGPGGRLVVHPDGSVEGVGLFGSLEVPPDLERVVDVSIADLLAVALLEDGSLRSWGSYSEFGDEFETPILPPVLPPTELGAVAIGAGLGYGAALTGQGRLVVWGDEFLLAETVLPTIDDGIGLSVSPAEGLVVRRNGRVAYFGRAGAWGVGEHAFEAIGDAVAVACGAAHALVLHEDGTVTGYGFSGAAQVPEGLDDVTAISAGYHHNLALRKDGTVVAWGSTSPVPEGLVGVVAIHANAFNNVAWTRAPFIRRQPEPVAAEPGAGVSLSVEVMDRQPVTYQWWHGDEAIAGATEASLELLASIESDSGFYRVTVSNETQAVTSREALVVVGRPWIASPPQALTVPAFSNAVFQVEIVSPLAVNYQWFFDGQPIDGANAGQLSLIDLSMDDAGDYSVEVSNSYGSVVSSPAHLTVTPSAAMDQWQGGWGGGIIMRDNNRKADLAQTFTAGVSGLLDRIDVVSSVGPYLDWPTIASVVEAVDGRPGEVVLGRVVAPGSVVTTVSWVDLGIYLQAGRQYALVLSTESPMTPASQYGFRTSAGDVYAGGDLWERLSGGDWQLAYLFNDGHTKRDLVFVTYVFPGIPALRIVAPTPDSLLRLGEPIRVAAAVSPELPPPDQVELLVDDVVVAVLTEAPYETDWTPIETGKATLIARVVVAGEETLSAPVVLEVRPEGPPNDDFVQRTVLTGDYAVADATLEGATMEPGEGALWPKDLWGSVWWEWTAPRTGPARVTAGGPEGAVAWVAVLAGTALDSAAPEMTDVGGGTFSAVAGRVYQIGIATGIPVPGDWRLTLAQSDVGIVQPTDGVVLSRPGDLAVKVGRLGDSRDLVQVALRLNDDVVATFPGSLDPAEAVIGIDHPGFYRLIAEAVDQTGLVVESDLVTVTVRPANDNYEQAIEIVGQNVTTSGANFAATRQSFEPLWASNQGGSSVWYQWTAPEDGLCSIGGAGVDPATGWEFGLLLATFQGGPPGLWTQVAQNALPGAGGGSWMATGGTTYLILVDGGYGEQGSFSFQLRLRAANDDYAMAARVEGLRYSLLTSFRGAIADPEQEVLNGLADAPSLWWEWRAPISSRATFRASSPDGTVRILVGEASSLAGFLPLVDSGPDWQPEVGLSLPVTAGTLYRIGVFANPGSEPACEVSWKTDALQVLSPRDNSTVTVPSMVRLAAWCEAGLQGVERLEYRANGRLVAEALEPPFAACFEVIETGAYRVAATAFATDGTISTSLPVDFLAVSGHDLPHPRVFAGGASDASYVVDSVGHVRLSGMNRGQFGLVPADDLTSLHEASWPEGVRDWMMIVGGFTDYGWSDLVHRWIPNNAITFASWALTWDGRLYRNGMEAVPFPPTVTGWKNVVAGAGVSWQLSTDGRLFFDSATEMTLATDAGPWADFGVGARGFLATLSEDGRAFFHYPGSQGGWNSVVVTNPPDVARWVALQVAAFQVILLDDQGRLHQAGVFGESTAPQPVLTPVPFPPGVSRWEQFSVGQLHALALGDNGQVYSWGRNWEGQLGIGQAGWMNPDAGAEWKLELNLVTVPPAVTRWSAIAAGRFHSLALGDDCALYAWGDNSVGQLGLGHGAPVTVPTRVPNSGVLCGFPVVFTDGEASRLPDGSFRLTFRSDRNRSYLIQYSDDVRGLVWRTAFPAVLGTGELMEWIDDGPPKTEDHPATVPNRFYRVVFE